MLEVVETAPPPSNPAASHPFLLVVSGAEPGRLHVIDAQEMIIGRSRFADISISERALSQQHCKLVRNGEFHRLFDLGSTNGTFVNEVRVPQADLRPGDTIRTGETLFTYMAGKSAAEASPPPPSAGQSMIGLQGVPDAPVVTAIAPYVAPGGAPPPTALAPIRSAPLAPATGYGGYAPMPQVLEQPPPAGEEGADLLTWLLRGIDFAKRYWLSILLLTLMGGGIGAGSYKVKKPPARAEFEISLVPQGADNPLEGGRRMNFEFFRDAQNNFTRPALIHEALKQLGETGISENRLRGVQASLEFQKVGQYSYKGAFTTGTPEEAVDYLDVHLKLYKDSEIEKALRVLMVESQTLEQQVADTEEQLSANDEALLAFRNENLKGLPEQAGERYRQQIELGSRKSTLSAEVQKAKTDLARARKQLGRSDPEIESRIQASKPFSTGISQIQRKIASMEAAGKGDQHPAMVEAREELAALEALRDQTIAHGTTKIVKSKNPLYTGYRNAVDDAEANYKNAMADLGAVTKDLKKTEELVEKLPRLQAEYAELTRTHEVTEKTHQVLFQKLQQVKVRLQLERAQAAARYDVITAPNVKPVSKLMTIVKRVAIGLFAGFAFGLGLGVLRDLRRILSARLAARRA